MYDSSTDKAIGYFRNSMLYDEGLEATRMRQIVKIHFILTI